MNALLKYPGAKWRLAPWIISHFPKHHSYLEPFFGSGAVLFNKQKSNIETVNDLDDDVINFFECIRCDPERLARELYFIPYARKVYDQAYEETDDPFEKARNFCIRLNQGHGFRTTGEKVGWKNDVNGRERAYAVSDWNILPSKIMKAAERLKEVQIEHSDAVKLIKRFQGQNVLIYCDPPYLLGTRRKGLYKHEMTDGQHEELLKALIKSKAKICLSAYDNEMYNDMLRGWVTDEKSTIAQMGLHRTEKIYMNYDPPWLLI